LNVFPKFQQAVAEFGLLLKSSAYRGSASFEDVIAAAQSLGLARTEEPR
jgi:hypothetical protein